MYAKLQIRILPKSKSLRIVLWDSAKQMDLEQMQLDRFGTWAG